MGRSTEVDVDGEGNLSRTATGLKGWRPVAAQAEAIFDCVMAVVTVC